MTPDRVPSAVDPEGTISPESSEGTSPVRMVQPSASYSITMRVRQRQRPGAFARVAAAIGETGAILGAIDLVRAERGEVVRDVTVACVDATHGETVAEAVGSLDGVTVDRVSDRTFLIHLGGKIEVNGTIPVKTRDDLSMAYTGLLTFPWVFHRGSGGQSPASLSIASAISGRGE